MSKQKGKRMFLFSVTTLCALATLATTAANAAVLPAVKEYVELNHPIRENMETYPGLSEVELYTKGAGTRADRSLTALSFSAFPAHTLMRPFI